MIRGSRDTAMNPYDRGTQPPPPPEPLPTHRRPPPPLQPLRTFWPTMRSALLLHLLRGFSVEMGGGPSVSGTTFVATSLICTGRQAHNT
mgnify:CR=1 FL=1